MRKKLFLILLLFLAFGVTNSAWAQENEIPEWLKRTAYGVSVETDQKPRIYFETVQPLYQSEDKIDTFFTHDRISILDDRGTYSAGLGYRKLMFDNALLGGINSFFDYQDLHRHYRAGIGLEALTKTLEFRTNSYIHLSPERIVAESLSATSYEKVVDGFDVELGAPVPYFPWLKVFTQYYYYDYKKFKNMAGNKVRLEIKPFKFFVFNLGTYDDNKGGREYLMDARLSLAVDNFTPKSIFAAFKADKDAFPEIDLKKRTLDRVERNFNIQVEKWSKNGNGIIEIRRGN